VAGTTPQQRAAGFGCWIQGNGAWVGYAALTGSLAVVGLVNNRKIGERFKGKAEGLLHASLLAEEYVNRVKAGKL